jgi:hypothetical protein
MYRITSRFLVEDFGTLTKHLCALLECLKDIVLNVRIENCLRGNL